MDMLISCNIPYITNINISWPPSGLTRHKSIMHKVISIKPITILHLRLSLDCFEPDQLFLQLKAIKNISTWDHCKIKHWSPRGFLADSQTKTFVAVYNTRIVYWSCYRNTGRRVRFLYSGQQLVQSHVNSGRSNTNPTLSCIQNFTSHSCLHLTHPVHERSRRMNVCTLPALEAV